MKRCSSVSLLLGRLLRLVYRARKAEVTAEQDSTARTEARTRLLTVLEQALRLLHPFMPYITEELWQRFPAKSSLHAAYEGAEPTVMLTAYPKAPPR